MRCDEIQGAQGAGNVEATTQVSGGNADVSDARYFSADVYLIRQIGKESK